MKLELDTRKRYLKVDFGCLGAMPRLLFQTWFLNAARETLRIGDAMVWLMGIE